jgi:flagellar biosynthetic protein FliR
MNALVTNVPELMEWVNRILWPMIRISAMFTIAPLFGSQTIPMRLRVAAAMVISVSVAPALFAGPSPDPLSQAGLVRVASELLIGLSMGFILQLAFASLYMAGEMISTTMGLSMAQMTDPANGTPVPVLGQFYFMMGMLIFLALNGHLALLGMLFDSFRTLPVGGGGLDGADFRVLAGWASDMFANAVRVALPGVTALLAVNVMLGVITRSAPQLNLFAFGLPITTLMGLTLLVVALPEIAPAMRNALDSVFALFTDVYLGRGAR